MIANTTLGNSPVAAAAMPVPTDSERIDLYASWKIVFEHAQAVDAREDGGSMQRGTHHSRDEQNAAPSVTSAEDSSRFALSATHGAASCRVDVGQAFGSVHASTVAAAQDEPRDPRAGRTTEADATAVASRSTQWSAALLSSQLASHTEPAATDSTHSRRVDAQLVAKDEGQPAAESVNVFLRGTSVAVVVRDAALSEAHALRTAFEAARELTGRRSALEQLILNGRTLYRQQQAPARDGAATGTVVFAC